MLVFPNCKINLGLGITGKRPDGFHNIETVFYPVTWCDAIEIIEDPSQKHSFLLTQSGLTVSGKQEDNLLYKAWELLSNIKTLPPIKVHLHKNLPMGAGLGGGSSDAAFFINMADQKFDLGLSMDQKAGIASKLGSDCNFFLQNKPVLAKGKGDEFSDIKIDLSAYYILIIYPNIHSNTALAYKGITPKTPVEDLKTIIEKTPVTTWKDHLINDFEETVFINYPRIKTLKDDLYRKGALYACMSGSGSSVFGIFNEQPIIDTDPSYSFYLQTPASKIL